MDEDRTRWNERYAEGFYSTRLHPTQLLADWIEKLPFGRALDLACGSGRNARFLASQGYEVVGIDISEVALEQAKGKSTESVQIDYIALDLDEELPKGLGLFDLIVLVRYVNQPLMRKVQENLKPGGAIMVEQHLHWPDRSIELAGPKDPAFRLYPGKLKELFSNLQPNFEFEGLVSEPDGGTAAITQLIATLG